MAQELLKGTAQTIKLVPQKRPSGVSCAVFKPTSSTAVATAAAVVSTVSTTVASSPDRDSLVVDDSTGITAGAWLWYESASWGGVPIHVSEVVSATDTLHLESPLPGDAAAADLVQGLESTLAVGAAVLDERGANWRVEATITPADGSDVYVEQTIFHVVAQVFRGMTATEAYRFASGRYASRVLGWPPARAAELAQRATDKVRLEVQRSGAYAHLVGDDTLFRDALTIALRLELANEGLIPAGHDPGVYTQQQEAALPRAVGAAIGSMQWLDRDDDRTVDPSEVTAARTIHFRRS